MLCKAFKYQSYGGFPKKIGIDKDNSDSGLGDWEEKLGSGVKIKGFDKDGEIQFLTIGKWFGLCATFLAPFSIDWLKLKYILKDKTL